MRYSEQCEKGNERVCSTDKKPNICFLLQIVFLFMAAAILIFSSISAFLLIYAGSIYSSFGFYVLSFGLFACGIMMYLASRQMNIHL